jgi:adenylate cyclase
MASEITLKLAKMGDLRVMSRASSARFTGSALDLREIGRELGVNALLTGGYQRDGNRCRLSAELVDVSEGFDSWADSYEVSLEDIFQVQDEVASRIAEALSLKLREPEASGESSAPTRNVQAYELYLQGKHAYYKFSESDNRLASRLLRRALDVDPEYGQAHAGLASTYLARVERGWEGDAGKWMRMALASSEEAIRLDPRLSEAFSARGLIHFLQKRLQEAEADIRQALELDPSNELAHNLLGRTYFMQGELGRAEIAFRTALDINPFYVWGLNDLAWSLWLTGRSADARATLDRVLEISPGDEGAHTGIAALHYFEGAIDEALAECEKARRSNRLYPFLLEILPVCLARAGEHERARALCEEALAVQPHDMVAHASFALVQSLAGNDAEFRKSAETALSLETFYTPFNLNFAIQYSFEGKQAEALQFVSKALREGIRNRHTLRRHPTLRQLLSSGPL